MNLPLSGLLDTFGYGELRQMLLQKRVIGGGSVCQFRFANEKRVGVVAVMVVGARVPAKPG